MNIIKIGEFIDAQIKEQYSNRATFSKNEEFTKQAFNKWLLGIIKGKTGANYNTLEKILNTLGYELVIKKLKKSDN